MPKTLFQKLAFGTMMALAMVYGMEVYNTFLNQGRLSMSLPLGELMMLGCIVILLQELIGGPLARNLAFRLVDLEEDGLILITLVVSTITVCCMCPMMSFVATILFKGVDRDFFPKWVQTTILNFPMALCLQICIAGPLVRFVFRKLFVQQSLK